jgi:hypothetical protein
MVRLIGHGFPSGVLQGACLGEYALPISGSNLADQGAERDCLIAAAALVQGMRPRDSVSPR